VTGSTLRALALRTLLPAFPGTLPPDWALGLTREGLAGFALFGYNIVDADQIATLTAQLRSARPDVIVATDEEGGDVTRLCYAHGSPYPGNAALGVVDDVDLTHGIYRAIGDELAAVGITLDMAPAVDVTAYRIVQESLTNVARHARGSTARLTVEYRRALMRLTVCDDGGAPAEAASGCGYGIVGMTERAYAIGGHLNAGPRAGGGFEVVADLPTQEKDRQ